MANRGLIAVDSYLRPLAYILVVVVVVVVVVVENTHDGDVMIGDDEDGGDNYDSDNV